MYDQGITNILIVLKSIREAIGKTYGDTVAVVFEEDTEPRVVKPPKDFQAALEQASRALEAFARLSYTHQKEYVRWIEDAKKDETRQRRIARAVEMLASGHKTPF